MVQLSSIIIIVCCCTLLLLGTVCAICFRKVVIQNSEYKKKLKLMEDSILEAEKQMVNARTRIEQSDKLKSAFLANMSHEIRTPLNAIMGFSSLLLESRTLDKDNKEYLEIINNNSTRLLDLMDEIFNIALIESGVINMCKEDCNVNELLVSLVAFFNIEKEMSGKNNVTIRARKANKDSGFTIYTDPRKFRQTLYNLVENALKYTDQGYIEVGYTMKDTSTIEFYVKDTGIGFPQKELDTIFEQFRQGDESNTRQYGGIGLGLSLSKKFVEMMGGTMVAYSIPGEGSTFYFTLPYTSPKV